ncbi:MAG: hypothetical protein JKY15_06420 [Deltaproteobacteria bacterium]|nr:hypothetical protein [Deltaproteobacteria bacterium]
MKQLLALLIVLSGTQLFAGSFTCFGKNNKTLEYSQNKVTFVSETWNFLAQGPEDVLILKDADGNKTVNAFQRFGETIYHSVVFALAPGAADGFYLSVQLNVVTQNNKSSEEVFVACMRKFEA